ncbi:uncharacterized protein KD926_000942 [Aspergillus affinis]|uniref:uncharacterized protein n=1 Tax=Aspergillus affinis TaxID=1070780 RepID=UPI0022FDF38E|nr:uncharacterized protein KD926_000942 [Aspergillus affinis]KAI9044341.1 hypothetical protein KD926_000942 [Aspergillus affinis]
METSECEEDFSYQWTLVMGNLKASFDCGDREKTQNAFAHAVMLLYDVFPKHDEMGHLIYVGQFCEEYEQHVLELLNCFLKMNDVRQLVVPWQFCDLLNQCQRNLYETNRLIDLENLCQLNLFVIQGVHDYLDKVELRIAVMMDQASVAESLGNGERAIEILEELYDSARRYRHPDYELLCRLSHNLGCCHNTANDHERALEWFQQSQGLWLDLPAYIIKNTGRCLIYLDDLEGARRDLGISIAQIESRKPMNRAMLAYAYFALATLERREQNFEMAELYFITAKRSWLRGGQFRPHPFNAGCMYKAGACCLDQGKVKAAIKHLRDSVEVTTFSKDYMPIEHARSLFKLSEALLQHTDVDGNVQNPSEVENLQNEAKAYLKMRISDDSPRNPCQAKVVIESSTALDRHPGINVLWRHLPPAPHFPRLPSFTHLDKTKPYTKSTMPRETTEKNTRNEGTGKEKRKPVRRDPERRRQQNIRAQRKYREKLRERMETLETLATSLAQNPPTSDTIQSAPISGYDGSDLSNSCLLTATPKDCQLAFPQTVDTTSNHLDILDPATAHLTIPDNALSSLNVWDSTMWDYTPQLSPSSLATSDHSKQIPPPETLASSPSVWTPPPHVDPSVLVHDKQKAGLDQWGTTTIVKCSCAGPHFQVQSYRPIIYGPPEVRILRIGSLAPAPDLHANHLRLDTMCTLAAMDTLRMHVGLTEEMVCAEESPSPFYRSMKASTDSAAKENVITTVQKIFKTLKPDLRPSSEQITVEHPPYIDVLPFRTLRKNLILHQQEVNEDEFLHDLLTGLVCWGGAGLGRKDRNASTGYASTGTPWDNRSWEAKVWFLKKYWSLLGGEDGELVRQSEWWRSIRDEDPLDIEVIA